MNILFISPATSPDYQCDAIAHGMREVFGESFVDYPRIPYIYADYGDTSHLYGKGFSLYGLLPNGSVVNRIGIEGKIADHFYDLIIYGSVHRALTYFPTVTKHYRRHEIILIDGEDQTEFLSSVIHKGIYFKRELAIPKFGVHPIHFAIPASKIGTLPKWKNKVRAAIDPRKLSTYVYTREEDYYRDYAESLFAITCKKAGWDCLRHYEIMAQGCIPWFIDLAECPDTTLTNLPKEELLEALTYMDRPASFWDSDLGHATWSSLWRRIRVKFVTRSTTRALAQYIIGVQQQEAAKV